MDRRRTSERDRDDPGWDGAITVFLDPDRIAGGVNAKIPRDVTLAGLWYVYLGEDVTS